MDQVLQGPVPAGTGGHEQHAQSSARRRSRLPPVYLDASAFVKLVKDEKESPDAWRFIADTKMASSELVITEVLRVIRRTPSADPAFDLSFGLVKAEILLEDSVLSPVDRLSLRRAGLIFEPSLRSLDAIHVMTALNLRPIRAFVTYDVRQITAARRAGLPTISPGA